MDLEGLNISYMKDQWPSICAGPFTNIKTSFPDNEVSNIKVMTPCYVFFIKKPVLERLHLYTEANHGGRLKIKMSYRYMDYHHENNHDTLIFIMKIPIPWKTVFLLRWTPILSFITIYLHWDGVDNWNPPSRKMRTRNLNQSNTTFIEWNLCYNIVSKMAVILFRPKYVNSYLVWLLFSFCEQCHHPLEVPCWGQYSVDI